MSDEKLKTEEELMTEEPLSPEEEAEIDRLLKMTAEEDDAKVDYRAIHDAVIEKARGEGVAVFAAPKSKEGRGRIFRRVLAYAGAAAAVFVVGFFAVSVLKENFPFLSDLNKSFAPNEAVPRESDKHAYIGDSEATRAPLAAETETAADYPTVTELPSAPAPTAVVKSGVLETPLPTECFTENAKTGYLLVCPFTIDPVDSPELLPALPGDYTTEESDTELYVFAEGRRGGSEYYYKCYAIMNYYPSAALGVGVARMTVDDSGLIHVTWRVTEDCWLEIWLEGFTEAEATALLKTMPLCDLNAFTEAA
ncbi:MAG: hypothetical protein J5854_03355 [Clostridia bacterium]|nr:hypothetical protein [Clostridia bacterium]